jgi:predicted ATP-dependent endonuclease of OLD family
MGKNSTTPAPAATPEFSPSVVRYGGVDISKTYKDAAGNVITEYIQSDEDKATDVWRKSQISQLEPQINVFSQELQDSWNEIASAQKNQSIDQFNTLWDPIARSTREDLSARGLSNSSIASDTQYNQDKIKAKALESIANDYVSELQNLQNNELSNRYMYLNYLNGGVENMTQDAFTAMTTGLLNSNSANSSNTEVWKTLLDNYNNTQSANRGWFYPLF